MTDRVSASITIGGILPASLVDDFIEAINDEGLSLEWDGEPVHATDLATGEPLMLYAHVVAWGIFNRLEDFCRDHDLAYSRWYGAYAGGWDGGRSVYRGIAAVSGAESVSLSEAPLVSEYCASEDDHVMIDAATAKRLGSYDAIVAHFESADFAVPPLEIVDVTASRQTDASVAPE